MCDRCGNRINNRIPEPTVNTNIGRREVPNSMRLPTPNRNVEIPLETVNVKGIIYNNRRLKNFGSDKDLNSIATALYIFIAFFIVIAVILTFFNMKSYLH